MKHHTPSLMQMAAKVRAKGQRKDTVLAHISSHEAGLLEQLYGKDINPHTGLPQYGLFSGLFGKKKTDEYGNIHRTGLRKLGHKVGHKVERAFRPIVKTALPVVGSVVGSMFGGPAGAVMGGALGGGLSSKRHPLDHALGGAFVGLGHSLISPHIAKAMNLNPDSGLAKMLGMNNQTWSEQVPGLGSLSNLLGGKGSPAAQAATNTVSETTGGGGGLSGLLGKIGLSDAINIGLGATALIGTAKAKTKQAPETETEQQVMERIRAHRPEDSYIPPEPWHRKALPVPEGYNIATDQPHWQYFEEGRPQGYAEGGSVKGEYIHGKYGGQTDNIYTDIPAGSYVWDATTLSLLGDGNSENGNEKVDKLEDNFMKTGIHRIHPPTKMVKAAISTGERVSPPWFVAAIGDGDSREGSKKLDKMRRELRKQKGVTKFLPPKSKNVMSYFKG